MRCMPPALLVAVVVLLVGPAQVETASAEARIRHGAHFSKVVRNHGFHRFHRFPHARARHHRLVKPRGHFVGFKGHGSFPHHGFPHHVGKVGHGHGFFRHHGFFPRHGFRHHGFFPHHAWAWPYVPTVGDLTTGTIIEQAPPPAAQPSMPAVPSTAELPVSLGIRSVPAGAPTVYVLDGGGRSLRRGGAQAPSTDETKAEAEAGDGGPRIIHLTVPRGR